jgi:hypothetical protein
MMSMSSEPPKRLAEILLEILALSKSTRASPSESALGSDPLELSDTDSVKDEPQRRDEEDNNQQGP